MAGLRCGTKEGAAVWCNLDACGLICAVVTYSLILYAQYAVTSCVLGPWMGGSFFRALNVVLFNLIACLAHTSHARAMLTDPGAVSSRAIPPASDVEAAGGGNGASIPVNPRRFCRKCNAYKPARAHHCSICNRCVVKMDHHCPWVNNCVGIGNHKFFIQFISYVFTLSVYALSLVVFHFMACVRTPSMCGEPSTSLLVVFLVVEAVLFGMFTMCMMCDQWETVTTNQTQIDRLKGETHSSSVEINEVFGGARNGRGLRWDYFLPTRVAFPADIWEEVMGYRCRDPCGLAAAAMGREMGGGALVDHAGDDNAGDVELGEFYSGGSGTVRERRQPTVETQRLLGKESGGGVSSVSGSPLLGRPPKSVAGSNGAGGDGAGGGGGAAVEGVNFREDHGVKRP